MTDTKKKRSVVKKRPGDLIACPMPRGGHVLAEWLDHSLVGYGDVTFKIAPMAGRVFPRELRTAAIDALVGRRFASLDAVGEAILATDATIQSRYAAAIEPLLEATDGN